MVDTETQLADAKKEISRLSECVDYWESKYSFLAEALRNAPHCPPARALHRFDDDISISGDWGKGKELQREYGCNIVPPICEAEVAAGAWYRITSGQMVIDPKQIEMGIGEIINRNRPQNADSV